MAGAGGERAEDAYALVTAAERYEAAMKLLDTQEADLAERGWVRLLAAALRRHDDRDRAFQWVEEVVRLAAAARDPSLGARAGVPGAAARLRWRPWHRRRDHLHRGGYG